MKNNRLFKGIMPALITPFDENGRVLKRTVAELCDYQLSAGVKGFYVCGATGEGPILRASTRMEMAETAMEAVAGRGVVIAHVGAPATADAVELVKHADKLGVDAVSSLAPSFFFKYSDDEIVEYYKRIASYTDKPVLVYATPLMTTPSVPALIGRLIGIENVVGVKFTIHNYYEMRRVRELNGGNINVINGPDETLLCGLVMGADGGIGSTYNVMPGWFAELYDRFTSGDVAGAAEVQYRINHVIEVILRYGGGSAVNSVKSILRLKGFDTGCTAFPAKTHSAAELAEIKAQVTALGLKID